MRATTNRKIMHEITKSMLSLIPRRSVIDETRCFLIEANEDDGSITVTANNMESAMQWRFAASIEAGGRFVMDARMLADILAHLEGEAVEFTAIARTVDITGGTCTYTMNTLACDGFPRTEIPFPGSTMKVSGIRTLYSKTCNAVDTDTASVLSGIHLEIAPGSIKATGCDKKCVAISRNDQSCGGSLSVTIPQQSLGQLASSVGDDELEVGICGANIVFMKEGLLFSARCIGAAYVDIGRIFNSLSVAYEAKLECKDFMEAVKNAAATASLGTETSYVKLDFGEKRLTLSTQNDIGSGEYSTKVVMIGGDIGCSFYYPAAMLKDLFKTVDGTMIARLDPRGYLRVFNQCDMFFLTPITAKAVEKQRQKFEVSKTNKSSKKAA